ncbi:MAG TPA: hypothetical protein VMV92_42515 [Streptosporangiaceae bacterium]|nr:hypothetical protein [Streptosporangiaceae bacterium]
MSLPASQQRILDRIEHMLRDSDPRLANLFFIFTRLTRDEDMPRVEEVKARLARLGAWIGRRTAPVRRRIPQPSDRMKAIFFFPAALATVTCALIIGASGPTAQRCPTSVRTPATELIIKARQCTLGLVRTPVLGH